MNDEISKKTLYKLLLIITLIYLFLQVIIYNSNDNNLSMFFWLENNNAKELIDAGIPEKSVYTPIIENISDNHFWILRIGLVVTLFFVFYYKEKDKEKCRLLLNIIISVVIILLLSSGLITWILKIGVGKPRPSSLLEVYSRFSLSTKYHSFPSGHAAETFSYIIPYMYFIRKYYLHIILLLYGFSVSFTRVVLAHHFLTDVLFGIYISTISGIIVCYMIEHRTAKSVITQ